MAICLCGNNNNGLSEWMTIIVIMVISLIALAWSKFNVKDALLCTHNVYG